MTYRKWSAGSAALTVAAVLVACDAAPSNPAAPSRQSGVGGTRMAAIADPGLPQSTVSLKATAPGIESPADGAVVNDPATTLTVTSPQAVYDVAWTFDVEFEVFEHDDPSRAVHSAIVRQGAGSTSHTLPASVLKDTTLYVWRVRAASEGERGQWSSVSSFTTSFVKIEPPIPLSPIGGTVTTSLRPQFFFANGAITGDPGRVLLELQVARDEDFLNVVQTARTDIRARGETGVPIRSNLQPNVQYFWRGRHTNRSLPVTAVLEIEDGSPSGVSLPTAVELTTEWSQVATFRTPTAAVAAPEPISAGGGGGAGFGGTGSSPDAPFTTGGGNAPNMFQVVQSVASSYPGALANSCQEHGGSWEFMDRVIEALRDIDGRWGYNCKRGNCGDISLDVITYYRGSAPNTAAANGSADVQLFDIILGHCGTPSVAWIDQTQATRDAGTRGGFVYPR